jgi:hypothetical protein
MNYLGLFAADSSVLTRKGVAGLRHSLSHSLSDSSKCSRRPTMMVFCIHIGPTDLIPSFRTKLSIDFNQSDRAQSFP